MAHFIHERTHQKQTAAARFLQVRWIGRIGESLGIKSGPFVTDDVDGFVVRFAGENVEVLDAFKGDQITVSKVTRAAK